MDLRGLFVVASLFGLFVTVIFGLGSALGPLLIAFALAYLLFPVIRKIEHLGMKRHYTVVMLFGILTFFSVLILALGLPALMNETQDLLEELPQSAALLIDKTENLAGELGYELHLNKDTLKTYVVEHTSQISGALLKGVSEFFRSFFTNALKWLLSLLNLFLIPLFFFYLINDYESIAKGFSNLIPPAWRPKLRRYLDLTNEVLSGYIRGQLLVAVIMGLLYGIGLWVVGLRFGFVIGFISGLMSIIPYAGSTVGFATAMTIGLTHFQGMASIVGVALVFIIVQALEGTIITPRLVGNKVGLSALATMLALIIGGNLLGLLGMLVAIPLTAVLKSVTRELIKEYQQLDLYRQT
jgi:predicted PurR-regulated permease PerM